MIRKHFVKYYVPDVFVSDIIDREISNIDVCEAIKMMETVFEKLERRPYAFSFITKENDGTTLDSKVTYKSGLYFLDGEIKTRQNLIDENSKEYEIAIKNMEYNNIQKVIITNTPWKHMSNFNESEDFNLSKQYIENCIKG